MDVCEGIKYYQDTTSLTYMIIIETKIFTRQIIDLLNDDEYREFQISLADAPDKGKIIKGSKGLRKIRWKTKDRGKRGGIRVIYLWFDSKDMILMLFAYSKTENEDLTSKQLKILNHIIDEEYNLWEKKYSMS